ncbi:DUF3040 domain-containing protein [Pseudonocardia nematodicida]|uniref:DUF3040 domain-containing protein n=1 Tax=Pseudonocardia nematodicida TaxID=1206997 RepID=A0ABV1KJF6_9PSEU
MRSREHRQFDTICRHLAADDPELARLLSLPRSRRAAVATAFGRLMLWAGVALLVLGVLLNAPLVFATGLLLAGTFWLPQQLARTENPSDAGGS